MAFVEKPAVRRSMDFVSPTPPVTPAVMAASKSASKTLTRIRQRAHSSRTDTTMGFVMIDTAHPYR